LQIAIRIRGLLRIAKGVVDTARAAVFQWVTVRHGARLALSSGDACLMGVSEGTMLDLVFVATTIAFFAIAWLYVLGCDRL